MWFVVEFRKRLKSGQKSISEVPEIWVNLKTQECRWPDHLGDSPAALGFAIEHMDPPAVHWGTYGISKVHCRTASYEKAVQKATECEETTNLETSDSEVETNVRLGKRSAASKVIRKNSAPPVTPLPFSSPTEPPGVVIPRPRIPSSYTPRSGTSSLRVRYPLSSPTHQQHTGSASLLFHSARPAFSVPSSVAQCSTNKLSNSQSTMYLTPPESPETAFSSNDSEAKPQDSSQDHFAGDHCSANIAVALKKFITISEGIQSETKELKVIALETQRKVNMLLSQTIMPASSQSFLLEEIECLLPLSTSEDLMCLETKLTDKEAYKALCRRLGLVGGSDFPKCVNATMAFLMSDSLAGEYTYRGQVRCGIGKPAFDSLVLCRAVIRGVRNQYPDSTDEAIDQKVQDWLKYASKRKERKESKQVTGMARRTPTKRARRSDVSWSDIEIRPMTSESPEKTEEEDVSVGIELDTIPCLDLQVDCDDGEVNDF